MSVKLLTEQHLEFLGLKGGCTGSAESALVKMPHSWKSHDMAPIFFSRTKVQRPWVLVCSSVDVGSKVYV